MKIATLTLTAAGFLIGTVNAIAQSTVYFEDKFDGDALAPEWQVLNENPDAYLVESGVLTLLSADQIPTALATAPNILKLNKPVPKGDWTMTTRFTFTPQSMGENIRIGLTSDENNSLLSSFQLSSYNYALTQMYLRGDKLAKGKVTSFTRNIFQIDNRDIEIRSKQYSDKINAVQLRLQKTGRQYVASARFEAVPGGDGSVSEDWFTVQQLTSLRLPGNAFTLMFSSNSNKYTPNGGEGLLEVDWVKIEVNE